ncbi:unnamed protein product [Urochloa decumbens]|uniref:DUF4220 domain-containing protein n=1 Tax=Urochloa decumbens TaxID=240449 RepID=A0ABC9AKK3_9POAL
MGFLEAVQWWEEWQLRVLVLASLFFQYFLYIAAFFRRWSIPTWFRFIIWLAYLGSDAITIYALAALLNRHKKQEWVSTHRDDASLEALWAPILLVHLGGVDVITAYNIEDNELWRRHVLTAVSQAAVAIYVFYKSWSGDKKLLGAAILIFVAGILKCLEKPVALKRASISSLMSIRDKRVQTQFNKTAADNIASKFLESDELYYLFVDMVPNGHKDWVGLGHDDLRSALGRSFRRLYTKEQMSQATEKHTTALTSMLRWPDQIAQYNLIGYLARDRKHWVRTMIMAFLGCKEYLDQLWCMKPCTSSKDITDLVFVHINNWKARPGAATQRKEFNSNRGHWILKDEGFDGSKILWESLRRSFDESVLIWHLATEFCYFACGSTVRTFMASYQSTKSKEISNYMAYLLFTNPEMLMTGTRPTLFRDTYEELKGIVPLEDVQEHEELAMKIIQKLKSGGMQDGGIAHDAWALSKDLMDLCEGDGDKMWRVIKGVWVEMLCFSASRCRGYLHAKSLGKGGEFLSYIWIQLIFTGEENLAEKMQRTDLHEEEDDSGAAHGTAPAVLETNCGEESVLGLLFGDENV